MQDEFFHVEKDLNTIMTYTRMLERFYPEKVIQICNYHHNGVFYISENCNDLFGIPSKRMSFFTLDDLYTLIHPDDRKSLTAMTGIMREHVDHEDRSRVRFTAVYRMKGSDGNFQTVEDERIILKTESGRFAYFITYTRTTEQRGVTFDVFNVINNKKVKIKSYLFSEESENISPRELEIVKLIDKGYNNAEISNQLSLSIFTVKNHKQRLFRKAQVKNSVELLRVARDKKLI